MLADDAQRYARGMINGRFHPFHNEHLRYFRWAQEHCDSLIIGITNPDPGAIVRDDTSEHRHRAEDNPYTYFERMEMIRQGLRAEGISLDDISFVPFPIHRPDLWRHYVPQGTVMFVTVYSPWEQFKVDQIRAYGMQVVVRDGLHKGISGQQVRALLAAGGDWEALVPRGVAAFLRRQHGIR